jgi:hypothetical protein
MDGLSGEERRQPSCNPGPRRVARSHGAGLLVAVLALCSLTANRLVARAVPWLPGAAMALRLDARTCLAIACGLALAYLLYLVWIVGWLAWGFGVILDHHRG